MNTNEKILFGLAITMGGFSTYLLGRLSWRAMFEGNGRILVDFNSYGEGWAEVVANIIELFFFAGTGVYFLNSLRKEHNQSKKRTMSDWEKLAKDAEKGSKEKYGIK